MARWTPEQRRSELHRLLKVRRRVVASRLAKEWGRSEKTVRRDLEEMRDELRLPIHYDPQAQSWRYTGEVTELQPMLVSADDRRALLFSLAAAAQLEGTPVCAQISRLYRTILSTLPPERLTRFEQMMRSVRFASLPVPPVRNQVWQVILLCLEAGEAMCVTYTDGGYDCTTQREVEPYGLIMRDRRWQLIAYCHRRKSITSFAVSRISTAEGTDRLFTIPPRFMDEYLRDAFGGYNTGDGACPVKLRIHPQAKPYVRERIWCENEVRQRQPDGALIITFATAGLFILEREIRAEGQWVEVLEPPHLRQQIYEEARQIASAHHSKP